MLPCQAGVPTRRVMINAPGSGKILKVRQEGTELDLDMEGGTTVKITTAEASSSVMLRDKAGKMEYAD